MDGQRFDALTKGLARGHSRRTAVGAIVVGGFGFLRRLSGTAAYPDEDICQKAPGGHCTQHVECCSGTCEDGHCPCPPKQAFCHGKCMEDDFQANPYHCGGCGKTCLKDAICNDGKCRCPEGTAECFGACVPGGDNRCECPEPCGEGCCPPNQTCCNGQCVHLGYANGNCGACGVACPEGFKCSEGSCVCVKSCGGGCCAPGQSCCSGDFCCAAGMSCCNGGCCPDDYEVCCGDYCCPGSTACFLGGCVGFPWLTSPDAAQATSILPDERIPNRPVVPPAPPEGTTS